MTSYQDIYLIIIIGTFVFVCLVFFIISYVVRYKRRQELHSLEKKELQQRFDQEILKTQLEIQEATFKTISQEIHDNIGQVLTLAKLNLGTVDLNAIETSSEKIEDTRVLVSKAIRDLRHLSHSLHTDYILDMGLPGAIEYGLAIIQKSGTCATHFSVKGSIYKPEAKKELILFRMVQECINNIIRHAEASVIDIQLQYEADNLVLLVRDDGKGFDQALLADGTGGSSGLGLKSIQRRAALIGADFRVDSVIGEGTSVCIRLPAKD